jgi:hypothetical protein
MLDEMQSNLSFQQMLHENYVTFYKSCLTRKKGLNELSSFYFKLNIFCDTMASLNCYL